MTSTVRIVQKLRPLRFTILVSRDDTNNVLRAFELNCALWGGILNPVVALETDPAKILDVYASSQSDYIVNLSAKPIPTGIRTLNSDRILEGKGYRGLLEEHQDGLYSFQGGLSIAPILRWYRASWPTRLPTSEAARSPNHFHPTIQGDEWAPYSIITHGSYPRDLTLDLSRLYIESTQAQVATLSIEDVASVNPLRDITPINFTQYGINAYSRPLWADFTSHILYLGDPLNPDDWLAFWNLRAFGMQTLFIPIEHIPHFEFLIESAFQEGHYPLSETANNNTTIQKSPSLSSSTFDRAIDEVRKYNPTGYELHTRDWLPEFNLAQSPWMGESHGPPPLEAAVATVVEQYDLLHLVDDRLEFKMIHPPFRSLIRQNDSDRWAVTISSNQIRDSDNWIMLPYSHQLESDLRDRQFTFREFRLSPRENIVLLGDHLSSLDIATLHLPNSFDVFKSYLAEKNLELTDYSEKGRYSCAIEKAMGGVYGGAILLRDPGIRATLNKLSHPETSPHFTRNELIRTMGESRREIVSSPQGKDADTPENLFDHLIRRHVIRPGLQFKCQECYRLGWYPVGQISDLFECIYCFTTQVTPPLDSLKWRYRSSGMFSSKDVGYGSLPVICTSLFFQQAFHFDIRTLYSFLAKPMDGVEIEVDLAALRIDHRERSELVICECASGGFDDADYSRMSKLSQLLPEAVFCLATLLPELSDDDKATCEIFFEQNAPLIVLTQSELETSTIDDTALPDSLKFPNNFHSLAYATRELNLRK